MGKKTISGAAKERLIAVRLNEADHALIQSAAGETPLSTWVRNVALERAAKTKPKSPAKSKKKPRQTRPAG